MLAAGATNLLPKKRDYLTTDKSDISDIISLSDVSVVAER
jgi:hypothetical protein